jgi:hypothetical protein
MKVKARFRVWFGCLGTAPCCAPGDLAHDQQENGGDNRHSVIVLGRSGATETQNQENDHNQGCPRRPEHLRHAQGASSLLFRSLFVSVHCPVTPNIIDPDSRERHKNSFASHPERRIEEFIKM